MKKLLELPINIRRASHLSQINRSGFAVALAIVLSLSTSFEEKALGQKQSTESAKKWEAMVPVDEAAEPLDIHKRSLRNAKNRRYNSSRSDQIVGAQPVVAVYGRIDESPRPSALPISESDAVILGTVTRTQPYLAENKKSIYTEFEIRVEESFKSQIPSYMVANNLLVLDQEGGALRLKDGRVLRYFVAGTSRLPALNGRYVFFLSLVHDCQDLDILTAYELHENIVTSLEENGTISPYANWNENEFLKLLRKTAEPIRVLANSSEGKP